jgi:LPXTG-motif cell wall-anchored protein
MIPLARRLRLGLAATLTSAALIAATCGFATTPAAAQALPITVVLDQLQPGVERYATTAIDIPVSARVLDALWATQPGSDPVSWSGELCGQNGRCLPFGAALESTTLAAGRYTVRIAATLAADAASIPGAVYSNAGSISFVEAAAPSALASTGTSLSIVALAAALLLGGLALLIARRRRAEESS